MGHFMKFFKKTAFALACALGIHVNDSHALKFTVNSGIDTGVDLIGDDKYNDKQGSTLRKVTNAIVWLYRQSNPDAVTPDTLIARFPGLQVDASINLPSSVPQRVVFNVSQVVINSRAINFGSNGAKIFFDSGDYRGAGVQILGSHSTRLFIVNNGDDPSTPWYDGVVLFFKGVHFAKGSAVAPNSLVDPNAPSGSDGLGGAFLIEKGYVHFSACTFTDNIAKSGGAIRNGQGTVRIYDSEFFRNGPNITVGLNPLGNDGGAISTGGGLLEIYGQAPRNFGYSVRVQVPPVLNIVTGLTDRPSFSNTFTEFSYNQANTGAAVSCTGPGGVNIFNARFSYNQVGNLVAPFGNEFTTGGAINASGGCNVVVKNSQLDHNKAIGSGSAVFADVNTTVLIDQNTFKGHKTYQNNMVSQSGQVHGGTIASRLANLTVRRNSFDYNQSEHGTILVWKTYDGSGIGGVHIGNNTIAHSNGSHGLVTGMNRSGFPWEIIATVGLTRGTGGIELRDITSAFWYNDHDTVVNNTIFGSTMKTVDFVAENVDATIGNNVLQNGIWNGTDHSCRFVNVRAGQIRGNVEDNDTMPSCVDQNLAGSTPLLAGVQSREIGYGNLFLISFPTLFLTAPHPGSTTIDHLVDEANIWDQRGFAREHAADPYFPGALVRESWN